MAAGVYNEKSTEFLQCFFAPLSIEMLNLWMTLRKLWVLLMITEPIYFLGWI